MAQQSSGLCRMCLGIGTFAGQRCSSCGGTGKCPQCKGSGNSGGPNSWPRRRVHPVPGSHGARSMMPPSSGVTG